MCCTVFLSSESGIVKEVQEAGRDYNNMVTNQPTMGTEKPEHTVFQRHDESHRGDFRGQGQPERLGSRESGRPEVARAAHRREKFLELGEWTKSCRHLPTYARPGQAPETRIISATDGYITYKWKKQEADTRDPTYAPLEEAIGTQDGFHKKKEQDSGLGQTLTDTMRGASGELREGIWRENSAKFFFPERGKGKGKGMPQFSQSSMDLAG